MPNPRHAGTDSIDHLTTAQGLLAYPRTPDDYLGAIAHALVAIAERMPAQPRGIVSGWAAGGPLAAKVLPDVPGKVHGIVSLDPPTVQCDGCAATYAGRTLARAVIDSEFHFNPRREHDDRRLCRDCAKEAGWDR